MAITITDEELDQLFLDGGPNNDRYDESLGSIWSGLPFDDSLLAQPASLPVNGSVSNTSISSTDANVKLEEAYERIQTLEESVRHLTEYIARLEAWSNQVTEILEQLGESDITEA